MNHAVCLYFLFPNSGWQEGSILAWCTLLYAQSFRLVFSLFQDTGREVEHLCSFLGLSTPVEEREKITKSSHFDNMKQNKMTNYSTVPIMDFTISPFMRKG